MRRRGPSRKHILQTVADKIATYDFARQMEGAKEVKTSEFASAGGSNACKITSPADHQGHGRLQRPWPICLQHVNQERTKQLRLKRTSPPCDDPLKWDSP